MKTDRTDSPLDRLILRHARDERSHLPLMVVPSDHERVPSADIEQKLQKLHAIFRDMGSVLVAYSGGVDSTFVVAAAWDVLEDRALAVTAVSPQITEAELQEAKALAARIGVRHLAIDTMQMDDPDFVRNDPRRCYYCKTEVYARLAPVARAEGLAWIANGTNTDDLGDYRPGLEAAAERRVRSPLVEAGLSKAEVRELSRRRGLPTWDRPASPCLASRLPYGTRVTVEALAMVGRSEAYLRGLGVREVRVRHHGEMARIEADAAGMALLAREEVRAQVESALRSFGYARVEVDARGYRRGSLNDALGGESRRDERVRIVVLCGIQFGPTNRGICVAWKGPRRLP